MRRSYFSAIAKLLAFVLAVTPIMPMSIYAEDAIVYGDIDSDASINATDALLALKHAAKIETLGEMAFVCGDVDGSAAVDAQDALWILKYAAKLIDKFPIEEGETDATPEPTETVGPTETVAPTETETVAPTETETVAPTETETVAPTETETVAPTETETVAPTETETVAPTETTAPTETADVSSGKLKGDVVSVEVKDETYASYFSIDSSLAVGDLVFGDRDRTFVAVDESLVGSEYIVTSCDSKKTTTDIAVVTAEKDMVLSVGFDARMEETEIPAWAADFTKTELTCENDRDVVFVIYQKEVKAGESVTLGAQGRSSGVVGYIAMATAKATATEKPTVAPTETVAPTDSPAPTEIVEPTEAPSGELIPFSGTIYIASDSIADGYDNRPVAGTDVVGWGNIFSNYFTDDVTVKNEANLGDSTKSYWYDYNGDGVGDGHRYKAIYQNIAKNDYVIICFGHNDGPANRNDVPVGTSSADEGSYQWYLKEKYIEPALAVGAQPILMTPVVRCFYENGVFTELDYHLKYGQAVRDLVKEYADKGIVIPLIDSQQYTYDLYQTLSATEAAKYHATNDTTHYNQAGCERICEYITSQLKTYNLGINQYIK